MPAPTPTSSAPTTAMDRCQANASSTDRDAGQHDRHAEPAPPGQRADQPRAGPMPSARPTKIIAKSR